MKSSCICFGKIEPLITFTTAQRHGHAMPSVENEIMAFYIIRRTQDSQLYFPVYWIAIDKIPTKLRSQADNDKFWNEEFMCCECVSVVVLKWLSSTL